MNFIIFDLEATCWKWNRPELTQEIIEIGAVKISPFGEQIETFSRFVKPYLNPRLSAFCQELTSINQTDVDAAKGFKSVIDDFQKWIEVWEEDYLLCSWGDFDRKMLRADCELHRLEAEWVETHINLKKQYAQIKDLRKPYGLAKAVNKEGFDFEGVHHRAISDAKNLAKIFTAYIDEWRY